MLQLFCNNPIFKENYKGMSTEPGYDALLPPEMARKAEYLGVRKAETPFLKFFGLSILAGAFISLGAVFATTTAVGGGELPYGVNRLLIGLVFCLGLIMVIIGGAELFTGNNLIVMAWASKKIGTATLLKSWGIAYLGNFVGAIGTVLLVFLSGQYHGANGEIGNTALSIASAKAGIDPFNAFFMGILCNALVCLAVWMSFSARTALDKIAVILFPISGFVAMGFEHSIANMYFIPIGLFIKWFDPTFANAFIDKTGNNLSALTTGDFLINNLIPVTLGNIVGGVVFVAAIYWVIFLRQTKEE